MYRYKIHTWVIPTILSIQNIGWILPSHPPPVSLYIEFIPQWHPTIQKLVEYTLSNSPIITTYCIQFTSGWHSLYKSWNLNIHVPSPILAHYHHIFSSHLGVTHYSKVGWICPLHYHQCIFSSHLGESPTIQKFTEYTLSYPPHYQYVFSLYLADIHYKKVGLIYPLPPSWGP